MAVDPWQWVAMTLRGPADAIQYACVLEATAPKAGNVHPVARFDDLCFADFVTAAELASNELTRPATGLGDRIYELVLQTRRKTRTNVNLGIALLLGPIVFAEEKFRRSKEDWTLDRWSDAVRSVLETLPKRQSQRIAEAIATSMAGGMDGDYQPSDLSLDVESSAAEEYDIMAGMREAKDRDLIAAEYAGGFRSFFEEVVPSMQSCVNETGDLLSGIAWTHLRLLASRGDTLIARKNGVQAEQIIREQARQCCIDFEKDRNVLHIAKFDRMLREEGHRRNPGTTADFVAAALYVCLRMHELPDVTA